jgi:hypothetical protein
MGRYRALFVLIVGVSAAGCSSDPNAAVNQSFPIRQMDRFFGSLSGPKRSEPGRSPHAYASPGYAPMGPAAAYAPSYAPDASESPDPADGSGAAGARAASAAVAPPDAADYTHHPGYAPAYPPY